MTSRERRLQVGKVGERQGNVLQLFRAHELPRRTRLERDDLRPQRLLLQFGPEAWLPCDGQKGVDNGRVERRAAFETREIERCIRTTELMDRLEKTRRVHDARGERDGVAPAAAGPAAVPLLEHRQQRGLHGLRHAQARGEPLRDLAGITEALADELAALQRKLQPVPDSPRYGRT